jgi:HK97 family phage prohead protease
MPIKREQMSVAFAIHDPALKDNSFRGMASVFNNLIDAYIPTRILPGAFTKTLQENTKRIKVLYQHNPDWPIGLPTKMEENADGLLVEARISDTTMGRDVLTLLRDGVITELSIGFDPVKHTTVEENIGGMRMMVRHITECRLWEFSPVTFAANSKATISNVNSLFSALRSDRDVELVPETYSLIHAIVEQLTETPDADPVDILKMAASRLMETHECKVLSAKNLALVKDCRDMLTRLVDAAEPPKEGQQASTGALTAVNDALRNLDIMALELKLKS